jgi:hypothetical protein
VTRYGSDCWTWPPLTPPSLDQAELHRALLAATDALSAELARTDPALADRLRPALSELSGTAPAG